MLCTQLGVCFLAVDIVEPKLFGTLLSGTLERVFTLPTSVCLLVVMFAILFDSF